MAFIQRFSVLFTKPAILGLEILLAVMRRLIADVFSHRFDVRRTDAEFAVSSLPMEIRIPRIERLDPSRRCSLDLLDNLRRSVVLGLRNQNVDVVAHGIDFDEG